MARTHTQIRSLQLAGEPTLDGSVIVTADAGIEIDPIVPAGAEGVPIADYVVVLPLDVSACKSVFIQSDQAVHFNVNSGAGESCDLVANQPMQWVSTDAAANPLGTTDITQLVFDNALLVPVNVKIRILFDATPA